MNTYNFTFFPMPLIEKSVHSSENFKRKKYNIKFLFFLLVLQLLFPITAYADNKSVTVKPWVKLTNEMIPNTPKIINECKKLEIAPESMNKYVPEFPVKAFHKRTPGYVIFDFTIDSTGNPKMTSIVAKSNKIFINSAKKAFYNLKFVVDANWNNSCSNQIYRIGYAFKLMEYCTGTEFPKPIIGVCSVGAIKVLKKK